MGKIFPTWQLSVETGPFDSSGNATTHLALYPPYTCEFDIRREYLASAQTGTFVVSQLGEPTRNQIYKDRYATTQYAALQFRAGYQSQGGFLPLLFNGTLRWAYSERTEPTNVRTIMEAFDGGFAMANAQTNRSVASGQSLADTLRSLNADLPNIYPTPIIGSFPQTSPRGQALSGPTWKIIQDNIPAGSFATIDNNQLKVLNDNEYIAPPSGNIPVISSQTGLLSPPIRSGALIVCELLFEPRLAVGQLINLQSTENTIYNGPKKVMGFSHKGTISGGVDANGRVWPGSVAGSCISTVSLWAGTAALSGVVGTSPQ